MLACLVSFVVQAWAADESLQHLSGTKPNELISGAYSFGEITGTPPLATLLSDDKTVGYSGKPIRILVGIDQRGIVRGIKLVEHKELIVLIGIPQAKVVAALNSLIGKDLGRVAAGQEPLPQVDIVSGATVTVLVMSDSVVRSAVKLIRDRPWRIGISDPLHSNAIAKVLKVKDNAVATSSPFGFRFDEGGRFSHIIDPRSGATPQPYASITVIAREAALADALSTAFNLMDVGKITAALEGMAGVEAHVLSHDVNWTSA